MPPKDNRIDARDWSLLAVLSILWGGSFFFNGAALRELPLLRMQGISLPKGMTGWKPFVAIGLLNNVIPFSLIVIGQTFIPSGLASILNATTPLFTVLVMAAAREEALPMPGIATWLAVLGLASLSTALAYIVFFQILRRSGATNVMLVTLLIPVTAILLGWLVLGEPISVREIAGAIVIGTALLVIDGRALRMLQRVA